MSQSATVREQVRSEVRGLRELPPLALNTQRLLDALADVDIEAPALAGLIEENPALAARIVGLARCAYFGRTAPVRSVSDAIIRVLGLRLVRNVAIGIVVSSEFHPSRCPAFDARRYWASALITGGLARTLARLAREPTRLPPDSAYLCGLLHNLGLLALVHVAPGEMTKVLESASRSPQRPLAEIESERLNLDHGEAGAWLAYRWQLPEEVGVVMARHQQPGYRARHWELALLVGVCAKWGAQRLAGAASPWIEPDSLRLIGIPVDALDGALQQFELVLRDVDDLGQILSRPSPR